MLVLEGLIGLHRNIHLQLLQHYWLGHRPGLLWYWMVCLGSEPRSFCHFWDGTQVLYFRLFCWLRATPFLLKWEEILATVVDTTVIWGNSPIPAHFSSLIPTMSMVHSCHLLFDHSQFALIHGPNIPGSYATLFFTASDFTSITSHIHNWAFSSSLPPP